MAIDLTRPAKQVNIAAPEYAAFLAALQGNALKSHGRNESRHLFLKFTATPAQVRAWIRTRIAPRVLSAAAQRAQSAAGGDGGLVLLFYLSAEGYRYLGLDPSKLKSRIFNKGMKHHGSNLIAELFSTDNKDPKPGRWEAGFQKVIHAMVSLADDQAQDQTRLLNAVSLMQTELSGVADILLIDKGRALRRTVRDGTPLASPEPVEHFGYFDGISQPLFTREDLDRYRLDRKGDPDTGWDPGASLDLLVEKDPFTTATDAYGSYLVYRKLHQDFGQFHAREDAAAAAAGLPDELGGALTVGRFEDGTPAVVSSTAGHAYTNDFVYKSPDPAKSLDPDGLRCPAHAHIRKVNPRGTTPRTSFEDERRRRITRRGIPYGKPMPGICDATEIDPNPAADRGLLFMCYQANIEKQFEFIQRTWVDNPNFPTNVLNLPTGQDTGDDPLIGQDKAEPQRWPRKWGDAAAGRVKFNFEAAVTLKGGEYFFAPSLPFLAAL
ncbi:MAG: peroxidase [Sphingomonas bacterium]|nr:peroxidase [Sphingomonas bacterium]MDB5718651.1 peroxidase [Sphingomonas bacterium]